MSSFKKELGEWILTVAAGIIIALIINIFGGLAIVEGSSMDKTLHDKDILLRGSYIAKTPHRGDIVAFKTDLPHPWPIYNKLGMKRNLIKRVIGLPGDKVEINGGEVYINGNKLSEPYINGALTIAPDGDLELTVPKEHIFVLGDNRMISHDSRYSDIGCVDMKDILGKTSFRLFPFNMFGKIDQ